MPKDLKPFFVVLSAISIIAFVQYKGCEADKFNNARNCETVKMAIHGVLTGTQGRDSYTAIFINNIHGAIGMNITEDVSKKGFAQYMFEPGDSVIKDANNTVVQFKRGDSTVVYKIKCDN